jgi:hypothetical protein
VTAEQIESARRLLRWVSILTVITVGAIIFDRLTGCSRQIREKVVTVETPAPPVDGPTCEGGAAPGDTREVLCEGGKIIEVCTADGYKEAARTCAVSEPPICDATKTTFTAVQPILTRSCNGCHAGYDEFEKAQASGDDYLRRFKLPLASPQHMPKGASLTPTELATFESWVADGYCEQPDDGGGEDGAYYPFEHSEQAMLADITDTAKVAVEDRIDIRYLVAVDQIDAGASVETVETYGQAARKAINSLSLERDIGVLVEVAPGIFRVNLDDFGIDANEWAKVEAADLVNIESKTSRGELLKLLTATKKPWLHVETFTDTALRNAAVYYDLVETPQTFDELVRQLGVDYARDLLERRALISAFVGSPLSPHNRMASAHDSRDGGFWVTYDTGPLDTPEKNFFQFPLLADVGGKLNGQFIAGEVIYTLPNGLHAYALFNAKQTVRNQKFVRSDLDVLQAVAPVNVVRDFLNPVSAEIAAGVSCFRCHAGGILPFRDQVRQHVIDNGAQFGVDKDLILAVYKPQTTVNETVAKENTRYTNVLQGWNIDPRGTDPITVAQDAHLLPWPLEKVCGTLWLRKGDCRVLLNQSATAQAQWGQLFSGGSITFEQFTASLQQVIVDLRLFQDPL